MYRIFNNNIANKGNIQTVGFNRIKYYHNLIKDYKIGLQRIYGNYLPSNHVLVNLCYALIPYLEIELDTYRVVKDNLFNIISPLKITSPYTVGIVHHEAFYTTSCIIFSNSFNILPDKDFTKIIPIKCIEHPYCSITFDTAPVVKTDLINGISAIEIDIPLFAVMFKKWYQQNSYLPTEEKETIILFLERYIIPNLIDGYLDVCIRNRLLALCQNLEPTKDRVSVSYITALANDIDRELVKLINVLDNYNKMSYYTLLQTIPFLHSNNYYEAVPTNIGILSNYSYPFQLLTFVNWLYPLIYLIKDFDYQKNTTDIEKVLIRSKRYIDTTHCLTHIPTYLRYSFYQKLTLIQEKFIN